MTDSQSPLPHRIKKEEPPGESHSNLDLFPDQKGYNLSVIGDENDYKYEEYLADNESGDANEVKTFESEIEDNASEEETSRVASRNSIAACPQPFPAYPLRGRNEDPLSPNTSTESTLSDPPTLSPMPRTLAQPFRHSTYSPNDDGDSKQDDDEGDILYASSDNYTEGSEDEQSQGGYTDWDMLTLHSVMPESSHLHPEGQFSHVSITDVGEFELRCHHYKQHTLVKKLPKSPPWSLEEENLLRELVHEKRGNWKEILVHLPGRTLVALYRKMPEPTIKAIYRGILHCCYPITKTLAVEWGKALLSGMDEWPLGVRRTTDTNACLTQNEWLWNLSPLHRRPGCQFKDS
ncbi:hypothetical protein FHETE_11383 [Fusarium heterosporum]|uniref:Myb-like domain-containing protein n=1 Tax=Fusarium heterosporum TaxID=42747 RepID=A0A8H5WBB7_FUSHE|nr:hypothetical protein FHETE_11383 [Fusarium heterosporum]